MTPQSKELKSLYDRMPVWAQNLLCSGYGVTTVAKLSSPSFRQQVHEFAQNQWLSPEQLRDIQFTRLQKMLQFAYANVPYYRRSFDEAGIHPQDLKQVEDIVHLPLLEKETVRSKRDELLSPYANRKELTLITTSGTTGSPLGVYWDQATWRASRAAIGRCRSWGGYQLWRPIATFSGIVVVPREQTKPPFWRRGLPERRTLFSLFHLSQDNLKFYFDELKRIRPEFIEGYPSVLFILAQYLQFTNDCLPIKAIFSGSEPLYAEQRELIESRFQARVYDYYGLAEAVASAGQCEKLDGYHLTMENTIAEVITPGGKPAQAGEAGEIVGTSLVNFSMPLIRYRTGDVGSSRADGCACGRGLLPGSRAAVEQDGTRHLHRIPGLDTRGSKGQSLSICRYLGASFSQ